MSSNLTSCMNLGCAGNFTCAGQSIVQDLSVSGGLQVNDLVISGTFSPTNLEISGYFDQTGSGGFSTGTGEVSLNGATTNISGETSIANSNVVITETSVVAKSAVQIGGNVVLTGTGTGITFPDKTIQKTAYVGGQLPSYYYTTTLTTPITVGTWYNIGSPTLLPTSHQLIMYDLNVFAIGNTPGTPTYVGAFCRLFYNSTTGLGWFTQCAGGVATILAIGIPGGATAMTPESGLVSFTQGFYFSIAGSTNSPCGYVKFVLTGTKTAPTLTFQIVANNMNNNNIQILWTTLTTTITPTIVVN